MYILTKIVLINLNGPSNKERKFCCTLEQPNPNPLFFETSTIISQDSNNASR